MTENRTPNVGLIPDGHPESPGLGSAAYPESTE